VQLNLTPQLYSILVERAESLINSWQEGTTPGFPSSHNSSSRSKGRRSPSLSREETLELIAMDVSRTFPQLCIFQKVSVPQHKYPDPEGVKGARDVLTVYI
jgi:hypothetical protein